MAQSQVRRNAWEGQNGRTEAEHRELLHAYIYDYCKKRNFHQAARAFAAEAGVATDQAPPVDNPTAFLYDWWGVFWDVFSQRSNDAIAGKDGQMSNHTRFLQHRREELLQQHRAYNNMASHQQQQQMRRASEVQPSNQSPQQQHPLHPPQQSLPPQQQQQAQQQQQQPTPQQQPQVPPQAQTPHMQSVPSQQRDARSSPASSTASLPNSGMPHPNSTLVNTPQSMPANLPPQQQHLPARHANSPSFSPQQMQRPDGMHPSENMVNSPMGQQMQPPMQRPQMNPNVNAAMFNAALSALNLQGRDPTTFTQEEKNAVHAQMRRQHQLYTQNMMRQNP